MKKLAALAFAWLLMGGSASAQMAESLKNQYHSAQDIGALIATDTELAKLESILKDPAVKVLCIQSGPESMNETRAKAILEWVRSGKTAWFYDARLGPWFGFEPFFITPEQFTNKPESGELGGKSVEGAATTGVAFGSHECLTGVGQVSVFLPRLAENSYGTVWVKGDTIGLLRFRLDSPAVAALRREGRGAIIFKPLLWPDALSGDRFQSNLLEYSAGFEIPGPAGAGKVGRPPGPKAEYVTGKPAVPLLNGSATVVGPGNTTAPVNASVGNSTEPPQPANNTTAAASGGDTLDVLGEGVMTGRIVTEKFRFETGSKSLNLTRKDIKSVQLGGTLGLDQLKTWTGEVHKGLLVMPSIKLDVAGEERTYEKRRLNKIEFGEPVLPAAK